MSVPRSWWEAHERLGRLLSDEPASREWVMQALEQTWGVLDPLDLERGRRSVALQRVSGVVLALEDDPGEHLAFALDGRRIIASTFARYFNGLMLDGPPWRMSPYEDLPTHAEWLRSADFEEAPAA